VAGLLPPIYRPLDADGREWGQSPLTYLYTVLILFVVLFLLLAGSTWRNERYLFMILPLLFLIAGAVLEGLLDRVGPRLRRPVVPGQAAAWRGASLALLVALFVGLTGTASAYGQEPGYDLAFRYLRPRWQPEAGERIVTFVPTAAMLYLEQCDYFAAQRGYEEYIVDRPGDGRPVDLWTATPLLDTTAELVELLASTSRVWFVVDEWRFQTRYEPGFVLTVLEGMDLAYRQREVLIFRGEGYTAPAAPAIKEKRWADFGRGPELRLTGFDLSPAGNALRPGEALDVTLHWQAVMPAGAGYVASLELVGPGGQGVARLDEPILRDLYQPGYWPQGASLPDRHRLVLPSSLAPGRYRLELALSHADRAGQPLPVAGRYRVALIELAIEGE
jgi:hypothetical protein